MSRPAPARGIPAPNAWSHGEVTLACLMVALATTAWLLTGILSVPGMRMGILTGTHTMAGDMAGGPVVIGLFLLTWVVMMAAMMLPAITPFTVGMSRLMCARHAGRGTLAALTLGYLLVWSAAGLLAYLVLRGFESVAAHGSTVSTRAGAVVLLAAGLYQFTPLKQWCLTRCRSPLALVVRYGDLAARSRRGAMLTGSRHGGYCLGCCWALMAILLAAGVMSLAWMATIAALITAEKVLPRGAVLSYALGVLLTGLGALLLVVPGLVTVIA